MWILMVEAGFAFFILMFVVWWTMFSGRPEQPVDDAGKRRDQPDPARPVSVDVPAPADAPLPSHSQPVALKETHQD